MIILIAVSQQKGLAQFTAEMEFKEFFKFGFRTTYLNDQN